MNYCHAVVLVESSDLVLWIIRLYWNDGLTELQTRTDPLDLGAGQTSCFLWKNSAGRDQCLTGILQYRIAG